MKRLLHLPDDHRAVEALDSIDAREVGHELASGRGGPLRAALEALAAVSTAATVTAKAARALGSDVGEAVAQRLECDARRTAEAALTSLALAAASLATPEREDGET